MGISPYIKQLRDRVGHDLLLLPSVAVIPRDEDGRMLLVRQADLGAWATIGGSGYRVSYPNGDQASYVAVVYDAVVIGGTPAPDNDETVDVGWFAIDELADLDLGPYNRRLLEELFSPG